MEVKPSFFALSAHWGWRIVLIFVFGAVAISVVFYAGQYLFMEDLGIIMPTRSYANQVGSQLLFHVTERINVPPELYRWRTNGEWDAQPEFSQAALFWFTYNSSTKVFDTHSVNMPSGITPDKLGAWQSKLTEVVDSTLVVKQAGSLNYYSTDDLGDYRIAGRIYKDEPKFVGLVMDMDRFRTHDLQEILDEAKERFPLLEMFTLGPDYEVRHSPMFLLIRDQQDSIITQLGTLGEYIDQENFGKLDYHKEYPYFKQLGFRMEIVVPHSTEMVWIWYVSKGFYLLMVVWIITLLLWARAEIRLNKQMQS